MADWKKVVIESATDTITQDTTGNAATATSATSAATLTSTRTFSATGDVTATAQNFNGSGNVALPMVLSNTAITGQTAKTSAVGGDILLIVDSEDSNALKKVTRSNFISGLGAGTMSSFNVEVDGANGVQVDDGETIDFISGVGAGFVIGGTASAPTITVNSVDSEIVHDNLSGFVANEHIDHSGVSITAGSGLTGGGTIAATRTINVGAGSYITVAADTVSVDATSANTASKVVARDASGNFSAGTITATLSGNATSATTATTATSATTATNANNVNLADESSDTSCNVVFSTAATGNQALKTGTNLTFNSANGTLTATTFSGALSGNASTATSATTATTATNATNATNVALADDSADTTMFVVLSGGATGNNGLKTDASGITYNAATETLTVSNLTVDGTTTTVDTANLVVTDKTIVIADGSADAAAASGAGITVDVASTAANMPELLWTNGGALTGWSVSDYDASGNTDWPVAIMSTGSGAPSGTGAGVGSFYTDTGGNLYLYV